MGWEAPNDLWCNYSPLMASCPSVVWVGAGGGVGWSSEVSWCHPSLLGELLEGSTPNPNPKVNWSVPVYDSMIRVTISPIPEGPHKPPSQEWYPGSTEGQALPWTLVCTGIPPRFPFPQPQLHFRTEVCCSPTLQVLPYLSIWYPIHLLNQFRPAFPVIT